MRAAAVVAVLLTACVATPTEPDPVGTWKRSYAENGVIDELRLAEDGTFTWTSHLRGDSATATGTYDVNDEWLIIGGAFEGGIGFALRTTFAADDTTLALGAYVPDVDGPRYHAQWEWADGEHDVYSWTVMPEVWMQGGSFLVAWLDPIWDKPVNHGGDYVETADTIMFNELYTFDRIGDGLVRDDGRDAGLKHHATWADLGLVFTRQR